MPDVQALRGDLGVFSRVVGRQLTDWQRTSLTLDTRITTIVAPRQSGKSRSLAVLALHRAFREREHHVLLLSAGEDASRRLLAEVQSIVSASPMLRTSAVDEQAGLLSLTNGSSIRSVPASEKAVRGWSIDTLLADECGLIPDDLLLGAAMPTTAARSDAKIVLAGSAVSASGAFYDHAVRGEGGGSDYVHTFRWALTDATWISPSVIAAARDSMSQLRFAAEYEGVFASGADSLFSRHVLDRVLCDRALYSLNALEGPARILGGTDWGATRDLSTLCAIGRVPNEAVFSVVCAYKWPAGAELTQVTNAIADSPAYFSTLTLETNGLGLPLSQEVVRLMRKRRPEEGGGITGGLKVVDARDIPFSTERPRKVSHKPRSRLFVTQKILHHRTAESKAAAYSALRMLIERQQLLIPREAEELHRELLLLRVNLSPSGTERIEAASGHDDLCDALSLALGPHRIADGAWRTQLARYAENRAPRSYEPVDESDMGAYQSVGGGEISGKTVEPKTAQPVNVEKHGRFTIIRR